MPKSENLTLRAVRRQVAAMGLDCVEVGIRDQASREMMPRVWSLEELYKAIPWLRRQNMYDSDIYVRPNGPSSIVLVDDVTLGSISLLKEAGLDPCAVVETSPLNFQAWIRLGFDPLENSIRTTAAKVLAKTYNGDPASADWRHFGRLAGFTNRKPSRREEDGRSPFVLLDEASGIVAPSATKFIREILDYKQTPRSSVDASPVKQAGNPTKYFATCIHQLRCHYGSAYDPSRGDWIVCNWMHHAGFSRGQVETAMLENSPNIDSRKAGHIEDYIRRTLDKIFKA